MSWIISIIIGAGVGSIAFVLLPTRQQFISSLITGIAGSILGVMFFGNILGMDPISSFGTISLICTFFGIVGSIFLIALTEIALEPIEEGMKKYEKDPERVEIIHIVPVYAHQFEDVKIRTKRKSKK